MTSIPRLLGSIGLILLLFGTINTAFAQSFSPDTYITQLQGDSGLLDLRASWNGLAVSSSSPIAASLRTDGLLSWNVLYNPANTSLNNYLATLANGTYTLQLYKGTIGDSTLLSTETLPLNATSSGSFDVFFPHTGTYILTYSITYPPDSYPIVAVNACHGDFCILPRYPLQDFENFMTSGKTNEPLSYGSPVPALLAMVPFTVTGDEPSASNILFLPGTMESRLYKKNALGFEQLLWEPIHNADISPLAFDDAGASSNQIYTRDVVDYLYSSNPFLRSAVAAVAKDSAVMYGPFENFLDTLVTSKKIAEWRAFPYDWRYDVHDIVQNGTLVGTASGEPHRVFLQDVVRELASTSPTNKVTIIAHSNGGLLAKALAVDLEKRGELSLLDQIILVGTPQLGTPSAIGNELHADGQTRALGIVTSGVTMRQTGVTLPGPYDLFPSESYFSYVATPVVTFADNATTKPYATAYSNSISAYDSFSDYLTDAAKVRENASLSDLTIPLIMKDSYVTESRATHADIDSWVPPASLSLVSITGIGQPTISGYTYSERVSTNNCALVLLNLTCSKKYVLTHEPTITTQGDDTVVSISAGANPGKSFYFDTAKFLDDTSTSIVHQSLLSALPVQKEITTLLTHTEEEVPYVSATLPSYNIVPSMVVSTHSPVTIVATDVHGRRSGLVSVVGTDFPILLQEIPHSSVQTLDDENYIYLPDSEEKYDFSIHGYDVGTTTIEIGSVSSTGSITTKESFANLRTTSNSVGSFSVSHSNPSSLRFDSEGDGHVLSLDPVSSNDSSLIEKSEPIAASSSTDSTQPEQDDSPRFSSATAASPTNEELFLTYLRLTIIYLELKLQLVARNTLHTVHKV